MSISISDVARKAGVSISTVSKALNDKSSVSSSTVERIKQTAEEMGYVPNSRARVFATKELPLLPIFQKIQPFIILTYSR